MIQLRSFLRCVTEHCVTRFEVCYDYQETTTAAGYNNIIGFISSVLAASTSAIFTYLDLTVVTLLVMYS